MFAAAGLTPPNNWEDLVTDAKKLTSVEQVRLCAGRGSYTENAHFAFINAPRTARISSTRRQTDLLLRRVVTRIERTST